ncbi:MAG: hypothetical protein ABIR33_13680 [Pyrinomonadaceae bacterium]
MRPANAPKANLGLFDRLSVKLLALFAATFLIGFLALWAYGISISYLETSLAEASAPQAPQPVVIDPNLRNELSQVMATTDATAEQAAIKDPFNDRTGLAGLNAVQRSVGGTVTTSGGGGGTTVGSPSTTIVGNSRTGGGGGGGGGAGPSGSSAPVPSTSEATKLRWGAYLQQAQMGDIPLSPTIFAVDDLLPVGVVDGGTGQQEVLFYSEAAARTFSFPIGTMFNDGWLSELRPEGVVFAMNDDRRSAKLRSWTRALRSVG